MPNRFSWKLLSLAAVSCLTLSTGAQSYQYVLAPGSTITPVNGVLPTGPSEALTGSFTWTSQGYDAQWNQYNWLTTALNFQSASFSLTLHPSSFSSFTTSQGQEAYFSTAMDAPALSASPLMLIDYPSTLSFEGDASAPTRLFLNSEYLWPGNGQNFVAELNLTAVLVPEPGVLGLGLLGFCALVGWRRTRR